MNVSSTESQVSYYYIPLLGLRMSLDTIHELNINHTLAICVIPKTDRERWAEPKSSLNCLPELALPVFAFPSGHKTWQNCWVYNCFQNLGMLSDVLYSKSKKKSKYFNIPVKKKWSCFNTHVQWPISQVSKDITGCIPVFWMFPDVSGFLWGFPEMEVPPKSSNFRIFHEINNPKLAWGTPLWKSPHGYKFN